MGQSTTLLPNMPEPQSNGKKIAVVVGVLVAHAFVLWGLANMKPMKLRPIEPPKPLKVKFIKLQEEKKPEPPVDKPKKKEPPPPPPPQKVEIVEKPKPTPPKPEPMKKVVKEPTPKPVTPPPVAPTPTPKPVENPTPKPIDIPTPKPVENPTPKPTPKPVENPTPKPTPNPNPEPQKLSAGQISWKSKPRPSIQKADLDRATSSTVVVRLNGDGQGRITNVVIIQSSGSTKIDNEVKRAVRVARFNPYIVNGVGTPIFADLPVNIQ